MVGALTFKVQVFHIQVTWDVFSWTTIHIYCLLPDQLLLGGPCQNLWSWKYNNSAYRQDIPLGTVIVPTGRKEYNEPFHSKT